MNLSLSRSFPIAKAALAAAVIACTFALACSLTGCASGGTDSSSADADNTSASTDGKTLRVAMELAYPPFETKDDAGNPEGLAVDFIRDFGAAYGYDVQIENTAWDGLIPSLQSDKADLVISSMTITDERKQSVDFSTSYATGIQSIVVKEDSPITSVDDLYADGADYQIGVQQDTTGDIYCSDDFGDDHVQRFNKGADAVAALVSGKLDCVVIDNEPAKSFVAANEGLKVLDTAYAVEDYAAAFTKGSELTEPFNQALEALIADGTVKTIVDKYISAN